MTGEELLQQLDNLIDDSYDITHSYQLLTQAKNDIERKYKLSILRKFDVSQVASPGDTIDTEKTLPEDAREVLSFHVGTRLYNPISLLKKVSLRNVANRYWIDWRTRKFGLTGAVANALTITLLYLMKTDDLTEDNADEVVVTWPEEFHAIIPYHVGRIIQANIDADETNFRMSAAQEVEYQNLLDGLLSWDQDIKLSEMDHATGYADEGEEIIDIGSL